MLSGFKLKLINLDSGAPIYKLLDHSFARFKFLAYSNFELEDLGNFYTQYTGDQRANDMDEDYLSLSTWLVDVRSTRRSIDIKISGQEKIIQKRNTKVD